MSLAGVQVDAAIARDKRLTAIHSKVIEAIPDIVSDIPTPFLNKKGNYQYSYADKDGLNQHSIEFGMKKSATDHAYSSGFFSVRTITLADVLRAIGEADRELHVSQFGEFLNAPDPTYWNLALSLDNQEPEVIEFLHKILCHD